MVCRLQVHRIGRTGRVGNVGKATSFFDPEQVMHLIIFQPMDVFDSDANNF